MSKANRSLWLFRNAPPLLLAAVLSALIVLAGLGLVFGLIVFLFFNGFGMRL